MQRKCGTNKIVAPIHQFVRCLIFIVVFLMVHHFCAGWRHRQGFQCYNIVVIVFLMFETNIVNSNSLDYVLLQTKLS